MAYLGFVQGGYSVMGSTRWVRGKAPVAGVGNKSPEMGALNFDVLREKKCKTWTHTLDLYTKNMVWPKGAIAPPPKYATVYRNP